ncbi:hypothetical protein LB534_21505 [Mesorhizobium sp. CA18]|uniref:hypothetical protein n=1 Tax=unclassified Mesorhizobium TaxID=325217 RepID=UPI001CCFF8A4|nr:MULTISPECIES: hypothetical protein [unclassified Mesorhizobium]MBZ9736105.1 hypothetical protein [Mesorhizobium sp. CA9]MBZ9827869.1 hypothetical protein [Mesorhizobium sp. CA18]MBZ9833675.1 hypothetical protein [Mesorhizobium sp. CA2]MBZ9839888.1 hypothetical protein [Mesorhizobium sp. CA3]MBZ9879978.1 hypothetical protein [Mesorhizobium sp. Ca11]
MPRYATIVTADDDAEIVSAIGEFEGASLPHRSGRFEQVAPGVRIGMVRGGLDEAVAGFGFPRQGLGPAAVRTATAGLKAMAAPSADARPARPAMARPRRKPARKVRKAKAAKAAPSDSVIHD